jgi:hypothetical protein
MLEGNLFEKFLQRFHIWEEEDFVEHKHPKSIGMKERSLVYSTVAYIIFNTS